MGRGRLVCTSCCDSCHTAAVSRPMGSLLSAAGRELCDLGGGWVSQGCLRFRPSQGLSAPCSLAGSLSTCCSPGVGRVGRKSATRSSCPELPARGGGTAVRPCCPRRRLVPRPSGGGSAGASRVRARSPGAVGGHCGLKEDPACEQGTVGARRAGPSVWGSGE